MVILLLPSPARAVPSTGDAVDVAPSGYCFTGPAGSAGEFAPGLTSDGSGTGVRLDAGDAVTIEWRQPRDIESIVLHGPDLPGPADLEVQYWYHIWPDGGSGGWQRLDDPFNGRWVTANVTSDTAAGDLRLSMKALDPSENPDIKKTGFAHRRTYRVRLLFRKPARVQRVQALTPAVWNDAVVRLEWKPESGKQEEWKGSVTAGNGYVVKVSPQGGPTPFVTVAVRYAHSDDRLSEDRGYLTFRPEKGTGFSVFVDDIVREGGVYVRDIDAFVSDASCDATYSSWKRPQSAWDGTVMAKVASLPEQSLEQVMRAIPPKPPREAHLGVPDLRQEFTITPSGNVELLKESLRAPGRDLDRRPWTCRAVRYALSTREAPDFSDSGGRDSKRCLEEGFLPVIHTEWDTGDLHYDRSAFATTLLEAIGASDVRRGDEPAVLLERIEITNCGASPSRAFLWTEIGPEQPIELGAYGLLKLKTPSDGVARPGLTPVRGLFHTNGNGTLDYVAGCRPGAPGSPDPDKADSDGPRPALRYSLDLAPGECHSVFQVIPYIELLDESELRALEHQDFDERHDEVVAFWKQRISRGMRYEVPEPVLNNLFRANLWHTLITTDRDPETGLYEHGAATMHYRVYANETAMVAQSLEMRGEHEEALRLLEPFLRCQGARDLPGRFSGKNGLLYAAHPDPANDPYTAQGYNMHHGWALWKLVEHFFYTRSTKYMRDIVGPMIAACDWISQERAATMVTEPDGSRPVEWGLAPAGDLEDVEEYLYWYATNAYYYVGMAACADALAAIGHRAAERIRREASDYARDILASIQTATQNTPVVRLRDGNWAPYVPPRTRVLTHLKEGWIREGLYPALHLLDCELLQPNDRMVTWMLDDLEDNIFLSAESGYGVQNPELYFFSLGGFNLQPNLCPNAMAHLRRDEIPHFIRVFWNTFWSSYYPDTVCFAEWVPGYGKGGGPLYKTPDECKFIQLMRNMLVYEEGNELRIGMGVPRDWMQDGKRIVLEKAATFFGKMNLRIVSHASDGWIQARLRLPSRNPAGYAVLRLRHPEGRPMRRVTIDGSEFERFDASRETIALPRTSGDIEVKAYY